MILIIRYPVCRNKLLDLLSSFIENEALQRSNYSLQQLLSEINIILKVIDQFGMVFPIKAVAIKMPVTLFQDLQ